MAARAACPALVTYRQEILIQPTTFAYFDVLESTLLWRTAEQSRLRQFVLLILLIGEIIDSNLLCRCRLPD